MGGWEKVREGEAADTEGWGEIAPRAGRSCRYALALH